MKAVVAAFNQEKALVGAFSVITNLRMELFEALPRTRHRGSLGGGSRGGGAAGLLHRGHPRPGLGGLLGGHCGHLFV